MHCIVYSTNTKVESVEMDILPPLTLSPDSRGFHRVLAGHDGTSKVYGSETKHDPGLVALLGVPPRRASAPPALVAGRKSDEDVVKANRKRRRVAGKK